MSELHVRFFLLDLSARFFLLSHSFCFLFVNSHENNACDGCSAEIGDCSECQNFIVNISLQIQFKNFSLECASNFLIYSMAPFYVWCSTVSRIQSHYKETVTFRSPGVPGIRFINLERIKAESTLEPLTGFESRTPWLEVQLLNHYAIASTQDPKVLGSDPKYMVDWVLKPNLISRLSLDPNVTFGSYKIKWKMEVQKFENLEDKTNYYGNIKSFLMIFL